MECGICNAIKKWFTKKDDKGDKGDKDDMTDLRSWLIMNDKEKIDRTLEIIKSTQDSLENQRLEFSKENKWETKLIGQNDAVDSLANTYFKAQKALLEKLKEALTS